MQVAEIDVASPALPAAARDADRARRYTDAAGENLVLLGQHTVSHDHDSGVVEMLTLHVTRQHLAPCGAESFEEAWRHEETVECEGLDLGGRFLDDAFLIRDLDGDGFAEILVGFSTFCGGGIDPEQIKLVLHTRERDYMLEGESIVQPPNGPIFGGSYAMTPHEDIVPAPFREVLLAAWERIRGDQSARYGDLRSGGL